MGEDTSKLSEKDHGEETPHDPEPALTEQEYRELVNYGLLFAQLLKSERFKVFFNTYYDLMRDEDTMTVYLVEVPEEVAEKRMKAALESMLEQVQGPETPIVTAASEADVAKEVAIQRAALKFKK